MAPGAPDVTFGDFRTPASHHTTARPRSTAIHPPSPSLWLSGHRDAAIPGTAGVLTARLLAGAGMLIGWLALGWPWTHLG
ncbi:hypothetical protein [Amycolatopsis minnesotensis]|uniref:Uncharacterized protein n=1 Tax=Amycolatopsis minnesotensis TaxID=337894 RepID=A0ABN2RZV4_9PSEU